MKSGGGRGARMSCAWPPGPPLTPPCVYIICMCVMSRSMFDIETTHHTHACIQPRRPPLLLCQLLSHAHTHACIHPLYPQIDTYVEGADARDAKLAVVLPSALRVREDVVGLRQLLEDAGLLLYSVEQCMLGCEAFVVALGTYGTQCGSRAATSSKPCMSVMASAPRCCPSRRGGASGRSSCRPP